MRAEDKQGKTNDYQDRKRDGSQSTFFRLDSPAPEDAEFPDPTFNSAAPGPRFSAYRVRVYPHMSQNRV